MLITNKKNIPLYVFIAGLVTELYYIAFLIFSNKDIPLYMFIYLETFLIMMLSFYFVKNLREKSEENEKKTKQNIFLKIFSRFTKIENQEILKLPIVIIGFGLIFRLTLFPAVPTTSDDVYRYLWEGKILAEGHNPFTTAPNDSTLIYLRDGNYYKVTFKDIPAIYPPFSQTVFTLGYFIKKNSVTALKLLYLICEIITLLFLLKLLHLKKKNLNYIILYSWLPLSIMEYFINAHLDPIGIMFMVMFVYFSEKDKHIFSAVSFSFAVLSKLYPVILFPIIIKKFGLKKSFVFLLLSVLLITTIYLPFLNWNLSVFSALTNYLANWEFNGSIYNLLKYNLNDGNLSKVICASAFIISIGIISIYYKDFTKAAYGIFISLIVFSVTLYPWYLGWIAAINPMFAFYSVTSLLFSINLTNFTPLAPVWKEYLMVLLIQYIPFFILLIMDIFWLRNNKEKESKEIISVNF